MIFRYLALFFLLFSLPLMAQEPPANQNTEKWLEFLRTVWDMVVSIWNFHLTEVDGKPITIGKLVSGLLLIVVGFLGARTLSSFAHVRLFRRLNPMAADILKTILFYLLVAIVVMVSLELINVPLTIFTLLGGAIAIGVGFGSQNLMNNFISGLILMAERPIRIGDLIQVGDLYGTIIKIGGRSTRVRTGDNIGIIVPNSAFLEQNVVNWTLGDDKVRTRVRVGVNYGSPTDVVRSILLQVAAENDKVLKEPEPLVLFQDFGDNALMFDVLFWINMRTQLDRLRVESDIRFRIDQLCREQDIVIAFPQRDVHLYPTTPFKVEVSQSRS